MKIIENHFLKYLHSFHTAVYARQFAVFSSVDELEEILNQKNGTAIRKLVLGAGSNILFTRNFDGLILKNEINGIKIIDADDN